MSCREAPCRKSFVYFVSLLVGQRGVVQRLFDGRYALFFVLQYVVLLCYQTVEPVV